MFVFFGSILKALLFKPKKKKEQANGATETKLNGTEAKNKKTKTKKKEEAAEEESSTVQSEAIYEQYIYYFKQSLPRLSNKSFTLQMGKR